MKQLEQKLKDLPHKSGVYIMHNEAGQILYIGKARDLYKRVHQYFGNKANRTLKVIKLVEKIYDLDYIITANEVEALVLENNLIKKHKPPYNILLKDDKSYPFIKIDVKKPFPRVEVVRKLKNDGAKYFGPYMQGISTQEILGLINSAFCVRTCKMDLTKVPQNHRPCLNYHIKRCYAPCAGLISREEYDAVIKEIISFLQGNDKKIAQILTEKMKEASDREEYELALKYISEAATKYQVFTSLVMPNLKNDAELEKKYGNMIRVDADTMKGGWEHFASDGSTWFNPNGWPSTSNMFTGLISWSHIAGRGKVVLDADFTRLNTFKTEGEKQSVISLQLMAGGPIAVADQYNTIVSGDLKFYQNEELLALNKDGFVGKPLSDDLWNAKNQIWYGQMSDGDYIIGFFNKEDDEYDRTLDFSEIGIEGKVKVRDLWKHEDVGEAETSLSYKIPGRSCKIVRLTKSE